MLKTTKYKFNSYLSQNRHLVNLIYIKINYYIEMISNEFKNKSILITGATGSFGKALYQNIK